MSLRFAPRPRAERKPLIGVLCCNELVDRPVQVVASRFIDPLSRIAQATVLLVPALAEACDAASLSDRLDGLLLTGSRSNVASGRYGGSGGDESRLDEQRDHVALALAERVIEDGRPVFGICRGLQELNVLFGGTLSRELTGFRHHREQGDLAYADLFDHRHDVTLTARGVLADAIGADRITVNSVHEQGIDRLGGGLAIEALAADDGLVEAFSARPCGGEVLAVQWHPEWDAAQRPESRAFFELIGAALRKSSDHPFVEVSRRGQAL